MTHAHLDHCGYLPVLVRHGYRGPIWCTEQTARLAEIVLLDAAHLQEQETEHSRAHGYSKHKDPQPLFDQEDARRTVTLFRTAPYDHPQPIAPGFDLTLRPAGHILGSAFVELELDGIRVLFSGDLGREGPRRATGIGGAGRADPREARLDRGHPDVRRAGQPALGPIGIRIGDLRPLNHQSVADVLEPETTGVQLMVGTESPGSRPWHTRPDS